MMGGERQGTVALPSQAGFDGTPGDRFGPEKSGSQRPVWKSVKARILLAGGVGDNVTQSVSSQVVVGVNGQSGGTQRDQERERRWRPVKALSQESDRKRRRSRIQTPLEAGAVLFRSPEYLGGGLMTCLHGGLWSEQEQGSNSSGSKPKCPCLVLSASLRNCPATFLGSRMANKGP